MARGVLTVLSMARRVASVSLALPSSPMQSILDEKPAAVETQGGQEEAHALFAAINQGDLQQVKLLLPITPAPAANASAAAATTAAASSAPVRLSVNLCDSAGFTPLIIASRLRHTEVVRYLLTHPDIDVNAHTTNYNTAFLYACAKGNAEIVQMLLEAGADFFFTNANNDTCLMCAAIAGDAPTVQFLFDAFHSILKALQSRAFAPTASGSHKRWVTMKNDEGLTSLMCATMSGSAEVVRMVLREARAEVGASLPASFAPSALTHFFPSIWPEVLGSIQFESASAAGYIDPSPAAFLAFVNAQNLMGDTALHIAAENQALHVYLLLVDNAGADPMKTNRRGRRSFELLDTKPTQAATAEDAGAAAGAAAAAAAPSDSSSAPAAAAAAATPSIQESLTHHLEQVITFQRECRAQYLSAQAKNSEKLFSELMEEEEESQLALAAHRRKKPSKAKVELIGEKKTGGKKKKKGNAAATTAAPKSATAAAKSDSEDSDASPSASPRLSSSSSSAAAAAASPSLSPAAAPYVPLAVQASADAASGWEVVVPKAAKVKSTVSKPSQQQQQQQQQPAQPAPSAAAPQQKRKSAAAPAAAVAGAAAAPASPKIQPRKNKSFGGGGGAGGKKPEAPQSATPAAAAASASTATTATATATTTATPVATLAATPITSVSYTLVPVPTPIAAPTAAASSAASASAADSTPSSSFFAAFSSRPRAWRPITALQRRSSAVGSNADGSSSSSSSSGAAPSTVVVPPSTSSPSSDSLQTLFSSLHPHIESTDLQLAHLLGADWHSLSMSQLSVLEEVYGQLARQIRDTQLSLFQQQQQETMSELVRTKSEVSALRKEVEALAGLRQQ